MELLDKDGLAHLIQLIKEADESLISKVYPVGSIYISASNIDPSILFGGTWEQIQDTFLLAAGSTYAGGSTGGEAFHTLTIDEMPEHKHQIITGSHPVSEGSDRWSESVWGFYDQKLDPEVSNEGTLRYVNAVGYEGSGSSHNNMPPYLAVYVFKRVS